MTIRARLLMLSIGLSALSLSLALLGGFTIRSVHHQMEDMYADGYLPAKQALETGRNMLALRGTSTSTS